MDGSGVADRRRGGHGGGHDLRDELYRKVQESLDIFEFLESGPLDGIWYRDLEHPENEWFSPRFWEVLGYDPAAGERPPPEWRTLVHPDDLQIAVDQIDRHRADPSHPYDQVLRYRHRDGSTVWMRCRGLVVRDGQGKPLRMLGAHTNVTPEMRAHAELRQSNLELRNIHEAVVRASGQLLYDWDAETGEVSYRNADSSLGYSEEELAGGLAHWKSLIHPADRDRFEGEIQRVVDTGQPFSLEYRVRRKDGVYIHVEDRGYFLSESGGRMVGFVFDVSEKKNLEDQVRQGQKMEAIGQLAGGVAHDFNNLLSVVLGYSDLVLRRLPEGDPLRTEVHHIREAGQRARAFTRQLLAFGRRQVLQPQVLDLATVVGQMDGLLRRLIGEDVDLRTVLAPDLGRIRFDPGQIEQILLNFAINARDAMPGGGKLTIEAANVELTDEEAHSRGGATPGPHVMLAVSDDGCGMDPAVQERIFEPFFTTKGFGKGTGLGLSTVYGIVKQSGGTIWVYSEPGKGTTFKVYLPRADGDVAAGEPSGAARSQDAAGTILVVEDEEMVRDLIAEVLGEAGYTVLATGSPREAVEIFEHRGEEVRLLLTDVVLPGMGGRQLAESLSARRPDLKVLYTSGYPDNAILHQGVLDPGVAFLEKPITPDELLEKLRETLSP